MRNFSHELSAHFKSEVTTLATCWKIVRRDGMVLGFTDHDRNLVVDDLEYDSIASFTATNVESGSDLAVDNLDLVGQLHASRITEQDLLAGKYDFAEAEIFLVNYHKPDHGRLIQKRGVLGEDTLSRNLFHAEIRGLTQFLSQTMCEAYTPHCRASLGDHRCRFNLQQEGFTVEAVVTGVTDAQNFIMDNLHQPAGWFAGGYVIWRSGNNKGLSMEVKESVLQRITLALPMPFTICTNDQFTIIAGCDRSSKTCMEKFNNIINFRGEPDLPGPDRIMTGR